MDDSVLTGENVPMAVDKNTRVLAGSRYNGSLMLIRVISRYEDCAVRQIRRVQNAAAEHKAALENSAQRNAKRLVPVVIVIAVLAAAVHARFGYNRLGISRTDASHRLLSDRTGVGCTACFCMRRRPT